jgi:hypothetical protein
MRYDELIEQYEQGPAKLTAAVRGLNPSELKAAPAIGGWTIQQIVIHLMDSDLVGTYRMKRIVAEDNPALLTYDEAKFAASLFYHEQPLEQALAMFELNRRMFANVLRRLGESAFERVGTHSQRGPVTLTQQLETYVKHLDHHLKFIYEKREQLAKPH